MSIDTKRSIFPLHLTPFESYMYVDDRARYPMTFVVEFDFEGEIRREAFQAAVDQALLRHPLLRANLKPAKSSRVCWVPAEQYDSRVIWNDLDGAIFVEGTGEFIDLSLEIGFRCWCRHDHERAKITFAFHHACCDGIGAYQFLGEVLWFYATQLGEQLGELPELPPANLRQRLRANVTSDMIGEMRNTQVQHVTETSAQPLAPRSDTSVSFENRRRYPGFHVKTYNKTEFRDLRLEAQQQGQTTNDRLLESLFVSMYTWNNPRTPASTDQCDYCVNMPLDLRQPDLPAFSAINLVTSAFVRRSADQIFDREYLTRSLREEAISIKHNRMRSEFMKMLVAMPVDLTTRHKYLENDHCHASVVFSNTGDPTRRFTVDLPREKGMIRAGNLTLVDLNGTPPLRSQTRAAISVFTYRRQLRLCFRFDEQYFTEEDGKIFVDHFCDCFEQLNHRSPTTIGETKSTLARSRQSG